MARESTRRGLRAGAEGLHAAAGPRRRAKAQPKGSASKDPQWVSHCSTAAASRRRATNSPRWLRCWPARRQLQSWIGDHDGRGPAFHALPLAVLGHPARADAQIRQAVAWAGGNGTFALAYCLSIAVRVVIVLRDEATVRDTAAGLVALAEEGHYQQFFTQGLCALGWAQARAGETTNGLAKLREGLGRLRDLGIALSFPCYHGLLADLCADSTDRAEAHVAIEEGLQLSRRTGDSWFSAELHRKRGALLLSGPSCDAVAAWAAFRRAVRLARAQSARLFELRAAMDLARLWRRSGGQ